jgi:hypothetical protein
MTTTTGAGIAVQLQWFVDNKDEAYFHHLHGLCGSAGNGSNAGGVRGEAGLSC